MKKFYKLLFVFDSKQIIVAALPVVVFLLQNSIPLCIIMLAGVIISSGNNNYVAETLIINYKDTDIHVSESRKIISITTRAFSSILELRANKIINHLSVAKFRGTHSYFYYRFEDLKVTGTETLLKDIEEATGIGIEPSCDVIYGKVRNENGQVTTEEEKVVQRTQVRRQLREKIISKKRELSADFIKYMNKYVNWDVESLIGYYPREKE